MHDTHTGVRRRLSILTDDAPAAEQDSTASPLVPLTTVPAAPKTGRVWEAAKLKWSRNVALCAITSFSRDWVSSTMHSYKVAKEIEVEQLFLYYFKSSFNP